MSDERYAKIETRAGRKFGARVREVTQFGRAFIAATPLIPANYPGTEIEELMPPEEAARIVFCDENTARESNRDLEAERLTALREKFERACRTVQAAGATADLQVSPHDGSYLCVLDNVPLDYWPMLKDAGFTQPRDGSREGTVAKGLFMYRGPPNKARVTVQATGPLRNPTAQPHPSRR